MFISIARNNARAAIATVVKPDFGIGICRCCGSEFTKRRRLQVACSESCRHKTGTAYLRAKAKVSTAAYRAALRERLGPDEYAQRRRKYRRAYWQKNRARYVQYVRDRRARIAKAEGSYSQADLISLFERQDKRCAFCRKSIARAHDVDHIVPLARGGSNRISNLQLLCRGCNRTKWAAMPGTSQFMKRTGLLF